MQTLKLLLRLLVLAPVLLLTACGGMATGDVDSTPDPARFERVVITAPEGEAQCDDDGDGLTEACLSQRQLDALFNRTIDALCEANDKLAWLSDYYMGTALPPSCAPPAPPSE
jgi:hypothetical protein